MKQRRLGTAEHRQRDAAQPYQERDRRPDAAVVERLCGRRGAVAPERNTHRIEVVAGTREDAGRDRLEATRVAQGRGDLPGQDAGRQPDLANVDGTRGGFSEGDQRSDVR